MRVRFVVRPGAGVQVGDRTYGHGEVADLPPSVAAMLVGEGRVELMDSAAPAPGEIRIADPEVEHREPVIKKRKAIPKRKR